MKRSNLIRILIFLIIIIIAIIIAVTFFSPAKKDNTLRIKSLLVGGGTSANVSDYKDSALNFYSSTGTFTFEIIKKDGTVHFSGIGKYTKTKTQYSFTYTDCWYMTGKHDDLIGETKTYSIVKGRVLITDPLNAPFYFGK